MATAEPSTARATVKTSRLMAGLLCCASIACSRGTPRATTRDLNALKDLIALRIPYSSTELLRRAALGDVAAVRLLLAAGMPVEVTDAERTTPLMKASEAGQQGVVDLLLERGADPRWGTGADRTSPLERATLPAVKQLLTAKAQELDRIYGHKPIPPRPQRLAATVPRRTAPAPSLEDRQLLTDLGVPFDSEELIERTLQQDQTGVLLLLKAGVNPNYRSTKDRPYLFLARGGTPLICAYAGQRRSLDIPLQPSDPAIAATLLAFGADPNFTSTDGLTPLMAAAAAGEPAFVTQLLAAGANPRTTTDDGTTALSMAVQNDRTRIVDPLLHAGADVRGVVGRIPPVLLARSAAMMRLLIDRGAPVNVTGKNGETPLLIAASFTDTGTSDFLRLLLSKGVPVNATGGQTQDGPQHATALFRAVEAGNAPAAGVLLDAGADPNLRTTETWWETPLTALCQRIHDRGDCRPGDPSIVQGLLRHHADPNVRNGIGLTPLAAIKGPVLPEKEQCRAELERLLVAAGAQQE